MPPGLPPSSTTLANINGRTVKGGFEPWTVRIRNARAHQGATAPELLRHTCGRLLRSCLPGSGRQNIPPAAPPAAAPAAVVANHPAATTGPTPGMASRPSPVSSPTIPPAVASMPTPVSAPSARSSRPSRSRSTVPVRGAWVVEVVEYQPSALFETMLMSECWPTNFAGAKAHLIVSAEGANSVLSEREKKTSTPPCRALNKPHVELAGCSS